MESFHYAFISYLFLLKSFPSCVKSTITVTKAGHFIFLSVEFSNSCPGPCHSLMSQPHLLTKPPLIRKQYPSVSESIVSESQVFHFHAFRFLLFQLVFLTLLSSGISFPIFSFDLTIYSHE